jgi:hypothetical protein
MSSAFNVQQTQGVPRSYQDDKDGEVKLIPHPVIGIVKDNIDAARNGKIRVYIATYSGINPDDSRTWISVNYMSPWFGICSPNKDPMNGSDRNGYGKFDQSTHSYGMWMSAPDIGTEVICIFINGRREQGYYIGMTPITGLHQMVPAIGGSEAVVPNKTEATTYGEVKLLPTVEANFSNPKIIKSLSPYDEPKRIHSYQASIFARQGIIRDNARGVISSSSQRESPSRVFGISTPGGVVYAGGYTNSTIREAAETQDISKLQQVGRTGGHTLVMDDGTIDGKDQLMRFRTAGGHQIMMNDSEQTIFIIHANGNSWIELGKEGTVDIFTNNSFNVRSKGDINLHADRDVNIHAGRNLSMFGNSVKVESDTDTTMRAGGNIMQHSLGSWSFKVEGAMTLESNAPANFASKTSTFITGKPIFLNTGSGGTPAVVNQIDKTRHIDTYYSQKVGWMNPSPNPFFSIVSRATTHQPYIGANKGVKL